MKEKRRFNITELLLIGFVAVYPLLVNPLASPVFGLPKLTVLKLVALALAGIWLFSSLSEGSFISSKTRLRLPLLAFFTLMVASGLQSVHPLTSMAGQYGRWEGVATATCYFILYLSASRLAKNKDLIKPLFMAMLFSAILVSIIAIIEHFWTNPFLLFAKVYCAAGFGQPNSIEGGRSIATFGNAMFSAAYFAFVLPITVSALFAGKDKIAPYWLVYLGLFLQAFALVLTFGRAAWIGAFAGIMLIGALNWSGIKEKRIHIIVMLLLIVVSFMAVQLMGGQYSAMDRITSIFKIEGSNLTRVQMWETSLPLIAENPLLGSGPDTFKYVYGKYKTEGWVEHISHPMVDKAHNDIIQIAVTQGLLGLASYLWIFFVFIWVGIKRVRALHAEQIRWLTTGILGAVTAYAIQLQFSFAHFSVAPYFWLFLGLGSGLFLSDESQKIVPLKISEMYKTALYSLITLAITSLAVLSILPWIADIHFARGRDLQALHQVPAAIAEYESATSINNYEPIYTIALADTLVRYGVSKHNGSIIARGATVFNQARAINPINEEVYFRAGAAFLEAGRNGWPNYLRESIEWHNRGLTYNPVMVDAYIDIGVAYACLNNYDEAINSWNDALEIEPNNARAFFNLGWAYEEKNKRELAKKAYAKAYELDPKMVEAKAASERL